eukprot:SAG11_NODE_11808_length_737_cov_1.133229_2_plen_82_part_00
MTAAKSAEYDFFDDDSAPPTAIGKQTATAPLAPLGMTQYLLGMQKPAEGGANFKIQSVALVDAPEGAQSIRKLCLSQCCCL